MGGGKTPAAAVAAATTAAAAAARHHVQSVAATTAVAEEAAAEAASPATRRSPTASRRPTGLPRPGDHQLRAPRLHDQPRRTASPGRDVPAVHLHGHRGHRGARGTVAFTDGGTPISELRDAAGRARRRGEVHDQLQRPGTHTIKAAYSGSGRLPPSSTSWTTGADGHHVTVSAASNPVPVGSKSFHQGLPFPAGGTVSFFVAGSPTPVAPPCSVESMTASHTATSPSPQPGAGHPRHYSGSPLFAASDSPSLPVQVQ